MLEHREEAIGLQCRGSLVLAKLNPSNVVRVRPTIDIDLTTAFVPESGDVFCRQKARWLDYVVNWATFRRFATHRTRHVFTPWGQPLRLDSTGGQRAFSLGKGLEARRLLHFGQETGNLPPM
jgi:hypothetical protein